MFLNAQPSFIASRDGREPACNIRRWGILPDSGEQTPGAQDIIRGLEEEEEAEVVRMAHRAICQRV